MAAEPNDPERCRLSVICQNYAQVEYLFTLPGNLNETIVIVLTRIALMQWTSPWILEVLVGRYQ